MNDEQDFENYLCGKLIDPSKFKLAEVDLYNELKRIFDQTHPKSFTAQKLFLINPIRRKYQLAVSPDATPVEPKKIFKPKIK